jgi:hypothetical protein
MVVPASLFLFAYSRALSYQSLEERLLLLPSTFPMKIPIVSLRVGGGKRTVEKRLLLDTGSIESYIFAPPKERSVEIVPRELFLGDSSIGTVSFLPVSPNIYPRSTVRFLANERVDGILGAEFFRYHDVLFDFKNGKVYCSTPDPVSGPSIDVIRDPKPKAALSLWNGLHVVDASVSDAPQTHFFVFDSGASCLCIPAGSLPPAKKSGRTKTISEGFDDIRGTTRTILVGLPQLGKEIRSSAFASESTFPLLPPSLISDAVFVSFERGFVADASGK